MAKVVYARRMTLPWRAAIKFRYNNDLYAGIVRIEFKRLNRGEREYCIRATDDFDPHYRPPYDSWLHEILCEMLETGGFAYRWSCPYCICLTYKLDDHIAEVHEDQWQGVIYE